MTRVGGDWLENTATQAIFALLGGAGHQVYAVGGCVRNALLKVPVSDVDFTTDARPETVMALAGKAGITVVPTGIEHGTVTLVVDGTGFEVTTFRRDIETDGRRAVVAYADTPEEDAHRRDFTINALYVDAAGKVFDPLGGLADIRARRLRFIDDTEARIREDYLRILRFFRFHAWFGDPAGGIDPDALDACARLADGLEGLSKERIGAEMKKLLTAPDPAPSLATMEVTGVLHRILPGATAAPQAVLIHLEAELGTPPLWQRRLACLAGEGAGERLRLSRKDKARLALYRDKIGSPESVAELAYRHGAEAAIDIALIRAAVLTTALPTDLNKTAEQAAAQKFPVRARDITTGEQGAALGAKLKTLEADWIASDFTLTKAQLLA